LHKEK